MTRLRELSQADLEARREEILKRLGTSYDDLAKKAEFRSLVGDEWAAWDELQEINFLIGDDSTAR
jgi:hypothetical protein